MKKPVCNRIWSSKAPPPFPPGPPLYLAAEKQKDQFSSIPLNVPTTEVSLRQMSAESFTRMCYKPELQSLDCFLGACLWYAHGGSRATKTSPPIPPRRMCLMAGLNKFSNLQDPPKHRESLWIQQSHLRTSEADNCQLNGTQGCPPTPMTAWTRHPNRYSTIKQSKVSSKFRPQWVFTNTRMLLN